MRRSACTVEEQNAQQKTGRRHALRSEFAKHSTMRSQLRTQSLNWDMELGLGIEHRIESGIELSLGVLTISSRHSTLR